VKRRIRQKKRHVACHLESNERGRAFIDDPTDNCARKKEREREREKEREEGLSR